MDVRRCSYDQVESYHGARRRSVGAASEKGRRQDLLGRGQGRPSGQTGYTENAAFGPWNAGRNAIILTELGGDFLQPRRGTAKDPLRQVTFNFMQPGHGTRSGSALSADGAGFAGIAPGLPLVPCRVTNSSLITDKVNRAIAKALRHVISEKAAGVVNISLGFPALFISDMGKAVDLAYEAGIIVVGAAGQETDRMTYPGKHRRTIGVAGIQKTKRGKFRPYETYHRYNRVDIWAPADPIRRANIVEEAPKDQFGDGTTYATVHVSAAAAMWLRKHGADLSRTYKEGWQRVEAFRRLLHMSARPLPFRSPRGNAAQSLDMNKLLRTPLPDPQSLIKEMDLAADDRV